MARPGRVRAVEEGVSHRHDIELLHAACLDDIGDRLIALQDRSLALRDEAINRLAAGIHRSRWVLSYQDNAWHVFAANGEGIASAPDLVGLIIRIGEMS